MELYKRSILSPEMLAEVKRLHFYTRKLADETLGGQYRSAFRGQGIEFEEVREYSPGDEIRSIDWKVTARSRKPFVKVYQEERELTVMLAVDVSASTHTATKKQLRESLIAQAGAFLTLIALKNNDKVGLLTFSDRLESYHPPRKARGAVWRILHEVLTPEQFYVKTDLGAMCKFLSNVLKRSAVIFIISDFIGPSFQRELSILSKRHDVTAVVVTDPSEYTLPTSGLVTIRDPENNQELLVDTESKYFRTQYEAVSKRKRDALRMLFRKFRIGYVELSTNKDFIPEFKKYFELRSRPSGYSYVEARE